MSIPSTEALMEQTRRRNLLRYGVDIEVELHPTREIQRDGHHFPVYVVSWRVGARRFRMLLEPVLVQRPTRSLWPFRTRLRWTIDQEATEAYLRGRIRTTTKPAAPVWPGINPRSPA